ncbi:MAG: ABC transporter substrate-binding protein [Campylobacteraceae bacterium]
MLVTNLLKKLFILLLFLSSQIFSNSGNFYKIDDVELLSIKEKVEGSHLKVYIPSMPYAYIMRLINGTLVILDSSHKGWDYYLAYKHEKVDDTTYIFWLREDVKFQDGTSFNADSVVENFRHFQKGAFTYTDIHNKLKSVKKLGDYKIEIKLHEPYGMLFNDLARINFYTSEYYKQYEWSKSITAQNTYGVGPYGAGPYILTEGYATGLEQSDKLVLKANPYFFEKGKPYIETITIYTKLPVDNVIDKITNYEGEIDIALIPFNKKTEIVNSKYAKLITRISTNNFSIHINLMKKNSLLRDQKVRQALNQALNQKNLIKFSYKNEGIESPLVSSTNAFYARDLSNFYINNPTTWFSEDELRRLLNNLELNVVTQDRFMFLWKGIEYQLSKYGVFLKYDITSDEKYVFNKLLTNRANHYDWDLLIWGNEDWYGHPWTSFFTIYTKNQWSAVDKDDELDSKFRNLFLLEYNDKMFQPTVDDIYKHIHEKAYMLAIPSPNVVMALNKEVDFIPSPVAIFKLWEAKITPYHWSIRGNTTLPKDRVEKVLPKKLNYEQF